jgi:hypothetical protein
VVPAPPVFRQMFCVHNVSCGFQPPSFDYLTVNPCYVSRRFIGSVPSLQKLGIIDYPIPTHLNPDKISARKNPSQFNCKLNNHYVFTAHISGIHFNIIRQSKPTFLKMSNSMTFSKETFVCSLVPRKLSSIQMKILE